MGGARSLRPKAVRAEAAPPPCPPLDAVRRVGYAVNVREYRAALRSTDSIGTEYVNTFAIKVEATGPDLTEPTATQVADQVNTWLNTAYRACLHPGLTFQDVNVHQLFSGTPVAGLKVVGQVGQLGALSGFVPREVCCVLSLKTAVATRSGRGRLFIPTPRYSDYLSGQDLFDPAGNYWIKIGLLGDALLAGRTFTESSVEYHMSTRVHSRVRNVTYDVTGYQRRSQPHWLRSRASAP